MVFKIAVLLLAISLALTHLGISLAMPVQQQPSFDINDWQPNHQLNEINAQLDEMIKKLAQEVPQSDTQAMAMAENEEWMDENEDDYENKAVAQLWGSLIKSLKYFGRRVCDRILRRPLALEQVIDSWMTHHYGDELVLMESDVDAKLQRSRFFRRLRKGFVRFAHGACNFFYPQADIPQMESYYY